MTKKLLAACLAAFALTMGSCAQTTKKETQPTNTEQQNKENKKMNGVTELTAAMFRERVMDYEKNPNQWNYKGTKPAIIDFYATWCGPCKATAPIVEQVAEEYAGKVDVYKVDVDKQPELAALFGVQSIPTILFIPTDSLPKKSVGAMMKPQFDEIIKADLLK
ncbi:thioredoxin [Prevotella dentasini]|uniref:thioredoxin n=1 Tax=Prevotella dentasini TaxID=589537 RepID=UPI000469A639|nr:thioredoxin [Prevotella dentasini]